MFVNRNQSGQFIFFDLVSAISGNAVTGASGAISGRKATDAISGMIVLSGNIIELGGGMYRANLYDFDTSGLSIGFLFTASGCVPRSFSVDTEDKSSGRLFPASGMTWIASGPNVVVPIASISGAVANSGLFVSVPIAQLSGTVGASGLFVSVPIAQLSGLTANSGLTVTVIKANLSGIVANSGLFVTATASVASGDLYLASGSLFRETFASGVLGSSGGFSTAWGDSGMVRITSGELVTPFSGANVIVPIASISGVVANSGLNVTVPIATISGLTANSGLTVTVVKATLSGIVANSGIFAAVPVATLSGIIANSGIFVNVPVASISGVQIASGTISGQPVTNILSGAVSQIWSVPIALLGPAASTSGGGALADLRVTLVGTANGVCFDTAATQTAFNTNLTTASGFWNDALMVFAGGNLAGQSRPILTYIDTDGHVTFDEGWTVAPASGDFFNIKTDHIHPVSQIVDGVWDELTSGHRTSGTAGQYLDNLQVSGVKLMSGYPQSGMTYIASGPFVNVPVASLSGITVQSGAYATVLSTNLSGVVANSGLTVTVVKDLLSGVIANSGLNVTVPIASISGVVANSGIFASVPIATLSGVVANSGLNVVVPAASLSGVVPASGGFVTASLNSGQLVNVNSGQLSGFQMTARTVSDKSGYVLSDLGLDPVIVESGTQAANASGVNARQMLAVIGASAAGRLSGAGTTTVRIDGAAVSGTTRIVATVNASGDRTASLLTLP